MVLRKLPVIILVFLPAFVWANSYYQFNLQLGGEYQERERIQGGESVTIAEEMHIFANIRFTSHLWSPRILKYMLLFNVDNSDDKIDEYAYTRETIGYGLHLTFFPDRKSVV